jgi:hypothetical protein
MDWWIGAGGEMAFDQHDQQTLGVMTASQMATVARGAPIRSKSKRE